MREAESNHGKRDGVALIQCVVHCLEEFRSHGQSAGISSLVEDVERLLTDLVLECVLSQTLKTSHHCGSQSDSLLFTVDGVTYHLSLLREPLEQTTWIITIRPLGRVRMLSLNLVQDIKNSIGSVRKLGISAPSGLFADMDQVLDYCVQLVEVCYSWLRQEVCKYVSHSATPIQIAMNSVLRSALAGFDRSSLQQHIWLVMTDKNQITYSIDSTNIGSFFGAVTRNGLSVSLSPAQIVSTIATSPIPYSKSFSREAWHNGCSIDLDIRKARYQEDHAILQLAQESIYEEYMTLEPIAENQRVNLLAVYPTAFTRQLGPAIKACTPTLSKTMKENRGGFVKDIMRLKQIGGKQQLHVQVGEMLGAMGWGFTRSFLSST